MKKNAMMLLWGILSMTTVTAALPPLYETLAEFKALLESPLLTQNLVSGEAILKVEKADNKFIVTTNKSILDIELIYEKTALMGPQKFHFNFYAKKLLQNEAKAKPVK